MPLFVERDALPIVRLKYVGLYSDAELERMLRELNAVLELPGKKVALLDLTKAKGASATQRQVQAQWIGTHDKQLRRDFVAAAIVADSAVIRGIVTAVFWIRPLPLPTEITQTIAKAEAWLAPHIAQLAQSR